MKDDQVIKSPIILVKILILPYMTILLILRVFYYTTKKINEMCMDCALFCVSTFFLKLKA